MAPTADRIRKRMKNRIRALEGKYKRIEETENSQSPGKSINQDEKVLLGFKERVAGSLMTLKRLLDDTEESAAPHECSIQSMSRFNESEEIINPVVPWDKERYLCIFDGLEVYCLDLKLHNDESKDLSPDLGSTIHAPDCLENSFLESCDRLPIIDSLEILENGLPVSAGLFTYGSDTYMVCGQELPGLKKQYGIDHIQELYYKYGLMGSSRNTFHLSLKDNKLSLSVCNNFPPLKTAKFLPIVEVMHGEIHVIESVPRHGFSYIRPLRIQSHEVLDVAHCGLGWRKISPLSSPFSEDVCYFIREHLVIGKRIFAKTHHSKLLVFERDMEKWNVPLDDDDDDDDNDNDDESYAERVGYDFPLGNQICVGEFQNSDKEEMYVVLGTGNTRTWRKEAERIAGNEWDVKMLAKAYLVTQMGEIRREQELTSVFEVHKYLTCRLTQASLFKVDERTVCIVALGYTQRNTGHFLYICTVTVDQVGDTLAQSDEKDFVKVVLKDSHFYKIESELWCGRYVFDSESTREHSWPQPLRLSACFLYPSSSVMARTCASTQSSTIRDDHFVKNVKEEYERLLMNHEQLKTYLSRGQLSKEEKEGVNYSMSTIFYCAAELNNICSLPNASSQGNISAHIHPKANSQSRKRRLSVTYQGCPFQGCPFQESLSRNGIVDPVVPHDKGPYLCVSDSLMIWCKILKESKEQVPPTIYSLKLPAEGYLVSLGSHAYVVRRHNCEDLGMKLLKFFHLSLVDDKLCETECGNLNLQQQSVGETYWPVVENINDETHVFESLYSTKYFGIESHTALSLSNGWVLRRPVRLPWLEKSGAPFSNHIVVGSHLYAGHWSRRGEYVEYDSKKKEWKRQKHSYEDLVNIKHVAQILRFGFGRCIGEYVRVDSGDPPIYVVLAVGVQKNRGIISVAFLVTAEGIVVRTQQLYRFFEGFEYFFKGVVEGTVTNYHKCGGEQVWCVMIREYARTCAKVITFTWEPVEDALDLVSDLNDGIPSNHDIFINVAIEGCYDSPPDLRWGVRTSACFL